MIRQEKTRRAKDAELAIVARDAEIIRERCATLEGFVREFWTELEPKKELKIGWALRAMMRHLEAVTHGDIQFLMMTVPPGMMKSLLMVMWTAWEWGPCGSPDIQVLATSYSQLNVLRDNLKLRRLIESDKYQALWPIKLRQDQNAKGKFENTNNGFSEARPFSSMTGGRGDRVKIDDPHSTETAESDAERQTAVRIFREGISDRMNDVTKSAIVIIMQRLHEQDVAGVAKDLDLGFVHLNLPMEYDPTRACKTYVNGELFFCDPRSEEGELLFPERFPPAEIERLKRAKGSYAYSGQYQQRPTPRGGGIFKNDWWQYWTQLPEIEWRCIYGDTAQKTKESSDYSVFQCWGKSSTGKAVLIDQIRGKWEAPELLVMARAFWAKHKAIEGMGALRSLKVEDKVSGTGLIQTIRREGVPVIGIQRGTDKLTRALDAAPMVESGNVLIPQNAPWLSDFMAEVEAFPNASHDDQVDPMADAIVDISGVKGGYDWSVFA